MAEPVVAEQVAAYLLASECTFERGSDEYYARAALAEALEAFRNSNYGIGAVAVVREAGRAREYVAGNAMVTGLGVVDHAETRAVLRIAAGEQPDAEYDLDLDAGHGLFVFGTLEPCPMCACVLTNAGATRSVSTVEDGVLLAEDAFLRSNGAANVLGSKSNTQPKVWHDIQTNRGMSFEILSTQDAQLRSLSERIFLETRVEIDRHLTDRTHVGHTDRIRGPRPERLGG